MQVVIAIIFTPQLSDSQSEEFQKQAAEVVAVFDVIYRTKYGARFVRTIVIAFRQTVSATSRSESVQTDVELVFNEESTEPLPVDEEIKEALVEAVNEPGFNNTLSLDTNSVVVTSAPRSLSNVQFKTNETFTADLSNSSSTAYNNRAELIKKELEPFFIEDYSGLFISLTTRNFSQGSIIHNTDLIFTANGTLPNNTQINATMFRAAQSGNLTFTITSLDGIALSSGITCSVNSVVTWTLVGVSLLLQGHWLAL